MKESHTSCYLPLSVLEENSQLLLFVKAKSPLVLQVEAYPRAVRFKWFFNNTEFEEWIGTPDKSVVSMYIILYSQIWQSLLETGI
jgi:hypothetical protein